MKKIGIMLLGAAGAASFPSDVEAQTKGGFGIQAELFDYNYRERQEGQVVVRDDGLFGGLGLSYVETLGGGAFLRGRLSVAFGSVDYTGDGSVIDEPGAEQSSLNNVPQSTGQLELHIGKDFKLNNGSTVTPFVGLGSRFLKDNSGGRETDDGLLGYDREISYGYVPLGIAAGVPIGGRTNLHLSAQYNWIVHGSAKSHFSNVAPELPDVKLDLNKGSGFELSALIDIPVSRRRASFGPFARKWNIGQSESLLFTNPDDPTEALELIEPKNSTTEIGLRLGFAF